jgi:UDP-N-acetylglucosamine--N-acetylmuramyl-(pentapeptide) pyrophosphoryl-undecaprenol N-acetylglucosamine transferase
MPRADGVLFCGGGTGGHVLPGLAVAARLAAPGDGPLRWIGDPDRLEAKLVPEQGIPLLPMGLSRPRLTSPRWLLGALRCASACVRELIVRPPRVVVALGGYAALLPGLIAPLLRRPVVVMEQNARPGRTNRLLARLARVVVIQFPEAAESLPHGKARLLGNPVRTIAPLDRGQGQVLRVLVAGGSLAAKSLNDLFVAAAPALAEIPNLELVHLAGEEDRKRVAEAYLAAGVHADVRGFESDMVGLYRTIDLAVARAGATTVAELCAGGIGAVYIPLPWAADDHQTANARAVERVGGAVVLPQTTTTPAVLAAELARLALRRQAIAELGRSALSLARPQAAAAVAELVRRSARIEWRARRARRCSDARGHFASLLVARTGTQESS